MTYTKVFYGKQSVYIISEAKTPQELLINLENGELQCHASSIFTISWKHDEWLFISYVSLILVVVG